MTQASSNEHEWDDLISQRLDGTLSNEQWGQAVSDHGRQLEQALQQAQLLRQSGLDEALPTLPDLSPLRTRIAAAKATAQAAEQTQQGSSHKSQSQSTQQWTWIAAASAAVMAAAVFLPLWLNNTPESMSDRSTEHGNKLAIAPTASAETSAVSRKQQAPHLSVTSEEPLLSSGVAFGPTADQAEPVLQSDLPKPMAESVSPAARAMNHPLESETAMTQSVQPAAPQTQSPSTKDEDAFAALLAEAETFTRENGVSVQAPPSPLPDRVLVEAVEAEERARLVGDHNSQQLRLTMTMKIVPSEEAHIAAMVVISLANRGEVDAPMSDGVLVLEGLNEAEEVIWSLPIQTPENSLKAGQDWGWAYPINDDQQPPSEVLSSRLKYGPGYSHAQPWPQ